MQYPTSGEWALGKIMRRILRKISSKEFDNFGDTSTLLNPEIIGLITSLYKDKINNWIN